ncbi:2,3-bisphosphoglycerate-independent phosphoglycerate mutase [Aquabacter cavernae]|uniref:2,3-bisphosphoglycerate-independent phosphoglycerate mutase n=1 Tax=Aquabacter cavernae TaxID=2496029 RepID=UPI000F8EC886|nr:2,3-bisphosphoglycerate-independent phosphoglycerate mutase [Aquabacter cavernae]
MSSRVPTMLVVLDGWGWRDDSADNAVRLARTPNFDRLYGSSPHAFLATSGRDVGLPVGQMGNSEVGHLNLGAGRVVMQDLPRIDAAIEDGSLKTRLADSGLVAALKASGGTCHILGLMSPGGVHAHQDHTVAVARLLAEEGIPAKVHAFTDGRDTPPRSGADFMVRLVADLPAAVPVATVCGRYYAMDRDNRWERVQRAYELLAHGRGTVFESAEAAVAASYAADFSDEFLNPAVISGYAGMADGDAILCTNFRADRAREILDALLLPQFDGFDRGTPIRFVAAAGMASYSSGLDGVMKTLFPRQSLDMGLGETVAAAGRTQLRMAETEKYPHVTYFFSGGREEPYAGEERILVPSPKVATYDLQPEMSAPELTDKAVVAIESGDYDLVILNFANPDMVGHTGSLPAAIKAVETVDRGLGRIAEAVLSMDGALLVTADHGNCELMRDPETGGPHTAHTTFPVPVMLVGRPGFALKNGRLADVAPTLLSLMGVAKPEQMTGQSLVMKG